VCGVNLRDDSYLGYWVNAVPMATVFHPLEAYGCSAETRVSCVHLNADTTSKGQSKLKKI
jgi:hypothetical protein